ncbi:MAG: hypothetical protein HYR94_19900 [Chloroflexi bacterium]|nr:hypothetical protein [Chloroflexota bacterium]
MTFLIYLLLTLPSTAADEITHTPSRPALSLPTAPLPTATPGPPPSVEDAVFAVQKPIKGSADCDTYGFKGLVMTSNNDRLAGVQIIVWEEGVGLVAVDTSDAKGAYKIEIKDKPAQRKFWVQVYQNDVPASEPLAVETQADCRRGFQIFQINWREISQ